MGSAGPSRRAASERASSAGTLGAPSSSEAPPWSASPADVAQRGRVDLRRGLASAEAQARLHADGPNLLKEVKPPSALRILVNQLKSLVVLLLAGAGVAAFAFGEWLNGTAIVTVLVINTLIGFISELRARRSMEALRRLGCLRTTVRRDGRVREVAAEELVRGDLVLSEAGDVITADMRLVEASKLEVDESTLTGESVPVAKSVEAVAADTSLADRSCMLSKGTAITRGTAEAIVVATGMSTELGGIARLVVEAAEETTPLEKRLALLGARLIWIVGLIAVFTTAVGVAGGKPLQLMIETGVALAVAAIPEGLPIVATLALARGMARMARRHALVNRLSAVETLGATTVIFTDKTGTLTENRMQVRHLAFAGVDGELTRVLTSELVGQLANGPAGGQALTTAARAPAESHRGWLTPSTAPREIVEAIVLCNNATLAPGERRGIGDPMEVALLDLGAQVEIERDELLERFPEVREEAFDTESLMMATVHRADGGYRFAVKGAAEAVLRASTSILTAGGEEQPLAQEDRDRWLGMVDDLASEGLRLLAAARRTAASADAAPYEGLTFLGLLGLADPPRAEVRAALKACRTAGIRVVMVTGDHAGTARSIARAVELVDDEAPPVVLGRELEALGELAAGAREELLARPVFARVTPQQKLELIATYQHKGHIVAMTGDGINDAPALRKADIGVAMGMRGTQVAREAADMVLTDDAFASIVHAVEQGRIIFDNIRRFVIYLLSCNVSEILVVSLAAMAGGELPLLPLQILFLNLVTDVFPALALAYGEGDPAILKRPPRDPEEPLITRRGWLTTAGYGIVLGVSVLASFHLARSELGYSARQAVTVSFLTLAFAQLWHVFNMRSPGSDLLRNEITRNLWVWSALALCTVLLLAAVYLPVLRTVLGTQPPGPAGWGLVGLLGAVPLALGQAWIALRGARSDAATRGEAPGAAGITPPTD